MRRGTLFVLLSAVLWGTTFPAIRYILDAGQLRPVGFLFWRFLVAAIAMLAIAVPLGRLRWRLFLDWRLLGLGVSNMLAYLLQYLAQDRTTASKTALLVNVNVLLTAILAYHLLKERIARTTWLGVALGALGVGLLATNGDLSTIRLSNDEFVGDLFAFGTGFAWTAYILSAKRYLTKEPGADVYAMTVVIFVVTVALLAPIVALTDGFAFHSNAIGILAILYLGILPTTGAFILYQVGLRDTGAATSATLLLLENIVAVIIAVAWLSEKLNVWTASGAGLILVAIYLASRPASPAAVVADPGAMGPGALAPRP